MTTHSHTSPYSFESDTAFERVKDVFALAVYGVASMATTILAINMAEPHIGKILSHFPLWAELLVGSVILNAVWLTAAIEADPPKFETCCPNERPCSHERSMHRIHDDFAVGRDMAYRKMAGKDKHSKNAHASSYIIAAGEKFIERATPEEFDALIAHEMAHAKNRDLRSMAYFGILNGVNKTGLFGGIAFSAVGVFMGLSASSALLPAISIFAASYAATKFFANTYSRVCERRADRMAVRYTKDPQSLLSALEKIDATPAWDKIPVYRNIRALCHTHPVGEAREANIHKAMRGFELP